MVHKMADSCKFHLLCFSFSSRNRHILLAVFVALWALSNKSSASFLITYNKLRLGTARRKRMMISISRCPLFPPFVGQGIFGGAVFPSKHTMFCAHLEPEETDDDAALYLATNYSSHFLDDVERIIERVIYEHPQGQANILDLEPSRRELVGVAKRINMRLSALTRNNDCRRCWLQRAHCICRICPPLEKEGAARDENVRLLRKVRRVFLLMHHKEIGLAVDTAKLLLATFPSTCRLVVNGIGPEYQPSMAEMLRAIKGFRSGGKCMVLFPTETARTFDQIEHEYARGLRSLSVGHVVGEVEGGGDERDAWDIIVIDGTWSQARKMHSRYIPDECGGGPPRVRLSDNVLQILSRDEPGNGKNRSNHQSGLTGHQLRRHPIKWREVSTLAATRFLFRDMMESDLLAAFSPKPWDVLARYQRIGDDAARKQLGPARTKNSQSPAQKAS